MGDTILLTVLVDHELELLEDDGRGQFTQDELESARVSLVAQAARLIEKPGPHLDSELWKHGGPDETIMVGGVRMLVEPKTVQAHDLSMSGVRTFTPRCSCGWRGQDFWLETAAWTQAHKHADQATEGEAATAEHQRMTYDEIVAREA